MKKTIVLFFTVFTLYANTTNELNSFIKNPPPKVEKQDHLVVNTTTKEVSFSERLHHYNTCKLNSKDRDNCLKYLNTKDRYGVESGGIFLYRE